MENATENDAIIEFAKKNLKIEIETINHDGTEIPLAKVPDGQQLVSIKHLLDQYRTRPERRAGQAKLTTLDSFIAFTNRSKDQNSAVFANCGEAPSLLTVFDYNASGATGEARFGKHRASYEFPLAEAWKRWNKVSGVALNQIDFANFIEKNILDLLPSPDEGDSGAAAVEVREVSAKLKLKIAGPDKLLELARGISVFEGAKVTNVVNTSSGETQLEFKTEHTDALGKRFSPPGLFLIGVQVFEEGTTYRIPVRLRYRLSNSSITWYIELLNPDKYRNDAVNDALAKAESEIELPLYRGSPESA